MSGGGNYFLLFLHCWRKWREIYRSCRGIGGWVFFGWRGSEGHRFDRFGLIRFKVVVIGRESSGEWWVRHHWLGMLRNRSNGRRLGVIFILWEKKEKYNFMKQQRILIEFELTCSEFAIESILFNLKDSKHTGDTHTSITLWEESVFWRIITLSASCVAFAVPNTLEMFKDVSSASLRGWMTSVIWTFCWVAKRRKAWIAYK